MVLGRGHAGCALGGLGDNRAGIKSEEKAGEGACASAQGPVQKGAAQPIAIRPILVGGAAAESSQRRLGTEQRTCHDPAAVQREVMAIEMKMALPVPNHAAQILT